MGELIKNVNKSIVFEKFLKICHSDILQKITQF